MPEPFLYDEVPGRYNGNKVPVNKYILLGGIVLACLAIIGVGLGVYFGTKAKYSSKSVPAPPATSSTTLPTTTTTLPPTPDIRLPQTLFPAEYILQIKTYLPSPSNITSYDPSKNFTFDGYLTLHLYCAQETDNVTLLMNQIKIHNVELYDSSNGTALDLMPHQYDNVTQKLVYPLSNGLFVVGNNYTMVFNYTGYLNDELVGFYRSNYFENGQVKWLAVTQFEPTDARRALPCFDEPSFKANFKLTLIHSSDMVAISNTIEENITDLGDGWNVTQFKTTPKMSTYLFAMCVAQFQNLQRNSSNGVLFRVWARPSFVQDAWFAVEMGPKVLDNYTWYFNIPFPLEKQDMLAIPDLAFGGMENWGMITYRERDILLDNNTYCATNIQRTATVIAHELAHMWFGDLVTLAWWEDLWLNEGFAEFFEYYGTDVISNGDFEMSDQFVPLEIGLTMQLDQLTSSHPIYDPSLVTPDEINSAFDDISYDKGACIIRMLSQTVGQDVFRAGLNYYLTNHEYSNANHQDLWNAIQWSVNNENITGWNPNAPLDVTALMNPWVVQMNFPVVNVTRDYANNSTTLIQNRFLLPGNFTSNPSYQTSVYNFTWYVPVWYNQEDGVVNESPAWSEPNKISTIENLKSSEWLVVNSGVYVLYRVNYDYQNWVMINDQLTQSHTKIDVRNRAQLLEDSLNLARAGYIPYSLALNTTLYLNQEMNYIPWSSAASSLSFFQDMFALTEYDQIYGEYLKTKIGPVYYNLGWDDTKDPVTNVLRHELRQFAITTMCHLQDKNCTSTAVTYFNSFLAKCGPKSIGTSNCSNVPNNIRKPVYCTGISEGNSDDFNFLFNKYPEEQTPVERDNILYGLCCTTQPWAINKLLNEAVNPSSKFIRQQDVEYIFEYLGQNDVARTLLWPFFTSHWNQLADLFNSGFLGIAQIIQAATRSFNTESYVQQMINFMNANTNLGSGLPAYTQQLELAEANVAWMQQYEEEVIQWFKNNTNKNDMY